MYFKIVSGGLALLLCCSTAALYGADIHSNMAGNAPCVSFLKARAEKKSLPYELWLSGYLTGLATYDKRINDTTKLELANGATGSLLLDSYCKVHPQETFQIAAREMARAVFYGPGRQR